MIEIEIYVKISEVEEVIEMLKIFLCVLLAIIVIVVSIVVLHAIFKSPFKYPYYIIQFDVSGKRSPDINNLIDDYLIKNGIGEFSQHFEDVKQWKSDCQDRIQKSKIKKLRTRQFTEVLDDEGMFCFELMRQQTRYRQVNYVKSSYKAYVQASEYSYNFEYIKRRYNALKKINFECTISEYYSKEQRKRMTTALRDDIALRDNYTCQICGKYMPDGVGLHIDHIIPIKKGGKSIPSNLQVLCSKCNGKKSSN